jgi:hypothetical protein
MKKKLALFVILASLTSCATIFNKKLQPIEIHTNEPVKVEANNQKIPYEVSQHGILVPRSKQPLHLKLYNNNVEKDFYIHSRLSTAFWLNFISPYYTGFLVDWLNQKRFAYPRAIYIDLENKENTYLPYLPFEKIHPGAKGIFKVTPLKAINFVNPGLELSYEWRNNQKFSSQVGVSYISPTSVWDYLVDYEPNMRGFSASFEERYYLKRPSPHGLYLSFELSYLKNNYNAIHYFIDKDSLNTNYNYNGYRDSIYIKKQTFSMNLKIGYQFFVKRISFDIYLGLGARYKDVRHFDRIRPEDVFESPRHPSIYYISDLEGKYWTASIPLSFKIGWVF